MAAEAVPAIQNPVGQFTANPLIRNMIGQTTSSFDFREAMDKRKILIINLSKGKIGDENMKLLGGLLVTKIYLAAMSRADVPDRVMKMLPNFYLFVDEFQNFANASFADILSEARKYKLNLTIAHQYVEQMDEFVRPAVFGNVGTMIVFRIGANDAELLEKEFAPQFTIEDLVNLGQFQMYLKLMIDGLTSQPFSSKNLPPIAHPDVSYVQEIIAASREQFAKPRMAVEEEIVKFHEATPAPKAAPKGLPTAPAVPKPPVATPPVVATPVKPVVVLAPIKQAPVPPPAPAPMISKPAPVPPVVPAPAPKAESTHKPFANLKDVLPVPPPAPKIAPVAQPTQVSMPKPPAAPAQPVSLSALAANKSSPKLDPKIPTKKNVDELKSALAAVLGNKSVPAAPTAPAAQPSLKASTPTPPPVPEPAAKPVSSALNEVPEDILKKVLKVD